MSEQSTTSADLYLLDNATDFREHSLKMLSQGQRELRLLSTQLDFTLYDNQQFVDALSELARSSRFADIQVLVKDTRSLIERGHRVLKLADRLPSKIHIRTLGIEPEVDDMAFLMDDNKLLLFKNDDREYTGFANYSAGPEVQNLQEVFSRLWQQSEADPRLRQLKL